MLILIAKIAVIILTTGAVIMLLHKYLGLNK